MQDKTRLVDATFLDDSSGLLLEAASPHTLETIYFFEAQNITKAALKYLSATPDREMAPFDYGWFLQLHREMFGDVWAWAGRVRHMELSIGVKAYLVPGELKKLADDIAYWESNRSFDVIETAARIHHRAVQIHPFRNGNGRWSRMLANIYLKQHKLQPTQWNENLLSRENPHRGGYIQALKQADRGDYAALIRLQGNLMDMNPPGL